MALHRLTSVTAYYAQFGLKPNGNHAFHTQDGGEQPRLEPLHDDRHRYHEAQAQTGSSDQAEADYSSCMLGRGTRPAT